MVYSAKTTLLKRWEPRSSVNKVSMQKFSLWIKLWNVPMELFSKDGISHIASAVGYPLYMDKATKER